VEAGQGFPERFTEPVRRLQERSVMKSTAAAATSSASNSEIARRAGRVIPTVQSHFDNAIRMDACPLPQA